MGKSEIIRDAKALDDYCAELAGAAWIGFDTEFVAEHTYRPQLCLIQVASPLGLVVIDPLAIGEMRPFWSVLAETDAEVIVHAGREELGFSLHSVGKPPANLIDVQIAAGLVGLEYPAGYGTLTLKLLNQTPGNRETRTDWRRRPLSDDQILYALDDVRHLGAIREKLYEQLTALGRIQWLRSEMDTWIAEQIDGRSREQWRRVSGSSGLGARELAIIRSIWRWRDAEAMRRDQPPRRILRDDLMVELARRRTSDQNRIRAVRGFERGDLRRVIPELAQAIQEALDLDKDELPQKLRRNPNPKVSLVTQYLATALNCICRKNRVALGMVATTKDVRDLVVYRLNGNPPDQPPPPLTQGWRGEIVGSLLDDLLTGKVSIRISNPKSEMPLEFETRDPRD
jgi:ribonuclease D